MSPVPSVIATSNPYCAIELAIDLILQSENLEAMCRTLVERSELKEYFEGAHVFLLTNQVVNYDSGHGAQLPDSYLEVSKICLASKQIHVSAESKDLPGLISVPFVHKDKVEAIAMLVLRPGASTQWLTPELSAILPKLTGFYLASTIGLGL